MTTVRDRSRSVCSQCGTHFRGGPVEAMFRDGSGPHAPWIWYSARLCHACRQAQLDYWRSMSAGELVPA